MPTVRGALMRRVCHDARRRCPLFEPLISPPISPDDLARLLPFEELASAVEAATALGEAERVALCSVLVDRAAELRATLGDARTESLFRELIQLVRRNLRGSDAVAMKGEEIVLWIEAGSSGATTAAQRVLSAARTHVFLAGTAKPPVRLTVSIGLATAPAHGTSFAALRSAARQARELVKDDALATASTSPAGTLNFNRFVGRNEPLSLLIDSLDNAVRGSGQVVAVIAEGGMGASTLVRMLEPEVRLGGGSLVVGTCREHRLPSPYALWGDVLRAVRRLPVKTTRQWRDLPLLDTTLERALEGSTQGSSKTRLLEELADFLRLAAQQRPLVIVLENMQWADDASWDALEYLIAQMERERTLIALTVQPGSGRDITLERWTRIAARPRHHEIRLTHLTRDEVKRWLEATLRTGEISREIISYVYRNSEGRPLTLVHLLRDLEESGHLLERNGSWHWSGVGALPTAVPVSELLARRIGRLEAGARDVLELAVVLGRDAEDRLLTGDDAEAGRARILSMVEAGLLASTFHRDRVAYVVSHSEVCRAVLMNLSDARRAELHARLAAALETSERATVSEIAEHFERAGDQDQAHRYALLAADRAFALHEMGAEADLLLAAERTAPTAQALAEVRVRMASVAEIAGRYEEAAARCDQALSWFESQGDPLRSLQLKRTRALVRLKRGQSARDTLGELLALESEARAAQADTERAAILLHIAQLHYRLGDVSEGQRIAEEVVSIAERGNDPLLLADASNRLAATIQLVNVKRARELFTRSLDIASSLGDSSRLVRALNNLGVLELNNNNFDESRRALSRAVDIARTGGMVEAWGRAELNRGVLAGRMAEYEEASSAFNEALRLASMAQNSEDQLYATLNLANLERDHERLREAADLYSLVVELAERIGQASIQAVGLAGLGWCRRALGDDRGAREALDRALNLGDVMVDWFPGRELLEALRLYFVVQEGNLQTAVARFEESLALADAVDLAGAAFLVSEFGQTLLPHARGLISDAVRRYADLPDVLHNARMRDRFAVLKLDS